MCFAAAYARRDLASQELAGIRDAMTWTLDRHWLLKALNAPAERLFATLALRVGASLLKAFTTPGPLRDAIENWAEVARHMATHLRTEARHLGGDMVLEDAARRLRAGLDAEDIALADLRIEPMFPLDAATRQTLEALAKRSAS